MAEPTKPRPMTATERDWFINFNLEPLPAFILHFRINKNAYVDYMQPSCSIDKLLKTQQAYRSQGPEGVFCNRMEPLEAGMFFSILAKRIQIVRRDTDPASGIGRNDEKGFVKECICGFLSNKTVVEGHHK